MLVAPDDSRTYWWDGTFAAAGRISDVAASTNHSLNGLLARALGEGSAARVGYLVGAALLVVGDPDRGRAVAPPRRGAARAHAGRAVLGGRGPVRLVAPLGVVRAAAGRARAPARSRPGTGRPGSSLAVVLLGTAAVITARPGPGVGPIPRTGLISLVPDTYLVLFLVVLVAMAVAPARDRALRGE